MRWKMEDVQERKTVLEMRKRPPLHIKYEKQ